MMLFYDTWSQLIYSGVMYNGKGWGGRERERGGETGENGVIRERQGGGAKVGWFDVFRCLISVRISLMLFDIPLYGSVVNFGVICCFRGCSAIGDQWWWTIKQTWNYIKVNYGYKLCKLWLWLLWCKLCTFFFLSSKCVCFPAPIPRSQRKFHSFVML